MSLSVHRSYINDLRRSATEVPANACCNLPIILYASHNKRNFQEHGRCNGYRLRASRDTAEALHINYTDLHNRDECQS